MLKWVQALMGEYPLPEELRTNLSEQSVLRAIENQRRIIEDLESKARHWTTAGVIRMSCGTLAVIDPHWYQESFDPFLDEPYWVMAEAEVPAEELHVHVMTVGEKNEDKSVGRVRLLFDTAGLDRATRDVIGQVDLECHNILMAASAEGARRHWRTGGPLNHCVLEVEQRSRRQYARDHQRAIEALGRAGFTLKPLSHGFARDFERPFSQRELERARDILADADIPCRVTCTVAQTFAEIQQAMQDELFTAVPEADGAWAFAFDAPSDGVIFALAVEGRLIGYEIDFIAGLKDVFERQKDLLHKSLGALFKPNQA